MKILPKYVKLYVSDMTKNTDNIWKLYIKIIFPKYLKKLKKSDGVFSNEDNEIKYVDARKCS